MKVKILDEILANQAQQCGQRPLSVSVLCVCVGSTGITMVLPRRM